MLLPAPSVRFFGSSGGYRRVSRVWQVDDPIGSVLFLHGIVSHSGWYLKTGAHLASAGFEVHMLDRRGSGLNRLERGHVDRYETWIADVEEYLESLDNLPRILLGVSWGGILAAAVARHRPGLLAGVGLICPGLFAKKSENALQRLGLRGLAIMGLRKLRFSIPLKDPALFTNSERAKVFIAADPLTLREITVPFALANARLARYVRYKPGPIEMPLLLTLAENDPITDNGRTRQFIRQRVSADKTIIEYPGCSHTLEFEPDPSEYLEDLSQWCLEIAGKRRETPYKSLSAGSRKVPSAASSRVPIAKRVRTCH